MSMQQQPLPGGQGGGFGVDQGGVRGEGSFQGLVQFVRDATEHLLRMLDALVVDQDSALGPRARAVAAGARRAIVERSDAVITAIESGEYDVALSEHGLGDGDPEWDFKYGVLQDGFAAFREVHDEHPEGASAPPPKRSKKWWKRGSWLLKKINIIFRSIAAAIPGAGALTELKDAVETVVEIEADETPD